MSTHLAHVQWELDDGDFLKRRYSRAHIITFDGGMQIAGSPSPDIVPAPFSDTAAVDPEEAFVASISACHMLWFLDIAARGGLIIQSYEDNAVGHMQPNENGKHWIARVLLDPVITVADASISLDQINALHHTAHENCFIANSVKTEIEVSGSLAYINA